MKSIKVSKDVRIDWYVHSSISNFSPDYLQLSNDDKKPFFTSFFLSDIHFRNDSLLISLWRKEYKIDNSRLKGIKVLIDTIGQSWNQASSRIGRLKNRQVDILQPHFVDTYCAHGECEQMSNIR